MLTGLRDFGYVEGRNIAIEWRVSSGRAERLPDFAAELVRLNVDVIVAFDNPAIVAAQKATRTIPIVMVLSHGSRRHSIRRQPRVARRQHHRADHSVHRVTGQSSATPQGSFAQRLTNGCALDHSEPERRALAREAEMAAGALGLQAQLVGVGSATELDSAAAQTAP